MDDILKKIKQIKYQCDQHADCANCIFGYGYKCKVKEIVYDLCRRPSDWDIENIEKKMRGEQNDT